MSMKGGDWTCTNCGDHQFARNKECRACGAPKSDSVPEVPASIKSMKQGDWTCANCGDHQFARNKECRACGTPKGDSEVHKKPGDWHCVDPECRYLNFAKNPNCYKCQKENPDHEGSIAACQAGIASGAFVEKSMPGDWNCPACGDHQFAKNVTCRKCGAPNPDPEASAAAMKGKGSGKKGKTKTMYAEDWYCSGCGDLQFARNAHCRTCGMSKSESKGNDMAGVAGMLGSIAGKGGEESEAMKPMMIQMLAAAMRSQEKGGGGKEKGGGGKALAIKGWDDGNWGKAGGKGDWWSSPY